VKQDQNAKTDIKPDEAAQIPSQKLAAEPPKLGASPDTPTIHLIGRDHSR
jgi:hypothetical protein